MTESKMTLVTRSIEMAPPSRWALQRLKLLPATYSVAESRLMQPPFTAMLCFCVDLVAPLFELEAVVEPSVVDPTNVVLITAR
jgi:hypothetical protein